MFFDLEKMKKTEKRQEPVCIHQKEECNGCPLMDINYASQLKIKSNAISLLFNRKIKVEPAHSNLFYRNKIELAYINKKLGFRSKKNSRETFQISKCWLINEKMNSAIKLISSRLKELGIESAMIMKRKHGLGYVVLRGNRKGEMICNFVFFGSVNPKIEILCKELLNQNFAGINIMQNETWSDSAQGKTVQTFGKNFIIEELLGKKFAISGNNFFQVNPEIAERIFSVAKKYVKKNSIVLDLYCGVGTIAICVSDKCNKIFGVELSEESIKVAKINAELNKIKNIQFFSSNAEKWLKNAEAWFDTIIVDPPRKGLEEKAIDGIKKIFPNRIIYISCNPESLHRDIKALHEYKIKKIMAFDQFPQTMHIEMLCILDKIIN
jgi:23S rRNA (uracil-5-)-methyltransferase RumA